LCKLSPSTTAPNKLGEKTFAQSFSKKKTYAMNGNWRIIGKTTKFFSRLKGRDKVVWGHEDKYKKIPLASHRLR